MDNQEYPTPIESNPSSSEPNSLPIPILVLVATSSTNSNTESEGNPTSISNKRKTSQIWDHFKKHLMLKFNVVIFDPNNWDWIDTE